MALPAQPTPSHNMGAETPFQKVFGSISADQPANSIDGTQEA
jgi:hypothetical protein